MTTYSAVTVAGYAVDAGDVLGVRANGMTYGWNKSHTSDDRDRNKRGDQLIDTLVQMQSGATWTIAVPNGTYNVKLSVGDSAYSSNNTITINGVNYWTNLALGVNTFGTLTKSVTVTDGKIVMSNAGAPDRMTKVNYIEIVSA
jgi:fibronectin type 3 domain-containing protein